MESAGVEPAHAAVEASETYQEKLITQTSRNDAGTEKNDHDVHSSGSSSQDEVAMQKFDSQIVKVNNVKDGDEALAHLPEHEREILKRQLEILPVKLNFFSLFRYATKVDLLIIVISVICAIVGGAVVPLMTVCRLAFGIDIGTELILLPGHFWSTDRHLYKLLQWHN